MRIYFDNAATTPVDKEVVKAMAPFWSESFGNSSSIHSLGMDAFNAVTAVRKQVAKLLNASEREIVFTSGATEANNLAIWGVLNSLPSAKYHFVTTKIEHSSVKACFERLLQLGHEVSYLSVDEKGIIDLHELERAIRKNTVLVSVMYANNETGSIQPISQIGQIISKKRQKRIKALPLYFHTDAVQAINYLVTDVQEIGCDLLSFSGHKFYAPKGIGALFIKSGTRLQAVNYGGEHEGGKRPGTLNVPAIVGLGKAIERIMVNKEKDYHHVESLKDLLIKKISQFDQVKINSFDLGLPNIVNVSFYRVEGESLLMMLDAEGIAISTGSACSSNTLEPSYVLSAMGLPVEWTHGSIRISLSKNNTKKQVLIFIEKLEKIVAKLRSMAPEL